MAEVDGARTMKSTIKVTIGVLALSALAASASAQSPRERLQQLTAQLQKTPDDRAIREQIIKLAAQLKPPPALPDEANRREGRGKFAFKNARSNEDYLAAAREYEEAVRVAPWIPGYYSDLCTIYEKAEKYVEAKRNCELSAAGATESSQIDEIKQRIAGLEFGIEKASSAKSALARLAGTWLRVDAKSDPRDWQALRASTRYPGNAYHRYRFLMPGEDKALLYMDQHGGKWDHAPDDFWTDAYVGMRTAGEWQWRMRVSDGRCGERQVIRPVPLEVLEQGNIIRTKAYGLLKETEFDRKSQSGELSQYRRQGLPVTPGPGDCFVVEFPAMFVRVGD
jgi:hypothetical protein